MAEILLGKGVKWNKQNKQKILVIYFKFTYILQQYLLNNYNLQVQIFNVHHYGIWFGGFVGLKPGWLHYAMSKKCSLLIALNTDWILLQIQEFVNHKLIAKFLHMTIKHTLCMSENFNVSYFIIFHHTAKWIRKINKILLLLFVFLIDIEQSKLSIIL
jgi:hypothetical protein